MDFAVYFAAAFGGNFEVDFYNLNTADAFRDYFGFHITSLNT